MSPPKAPTKVPTKAPTKVPTKAPTKVPTKVPTKAPTKVPTPAPTGILSHSVCKHTVCFYSHGRTHVSGSSLFPEKWHCEKTGDGCTCVCHSSFQCALRHHHVTGYKKTFTHC